MPTISRSIDWILIRQQLEMVNRMAMEDLMDLMRVVSDMGPDQARAYLLEAIPVLVDTYGGAASELSVAWWDDLFQGVEGIPDTVPPRLPPIEQITAQIRWGTSPMYSDGDPVTRLASMLQQHIFGAQRNTVVDNSKLLGVRYARHARGDACGFCRVVASRGAVYGSAARAKYVGATGSTAHYVDGSARGRRIKRGRVRGVQKAGEKYHDHCRCVVGPEASHLDLALPDYYDRFEAEYDQAVRLLDRETDHRGNYNMSDITRAMRSLGLAA